MKGKIILGSLFVALCGLLITCNSPFFGSPQEESDEGTFIILIGSNAGRAVTELPWDSSVSLTDLRHTIRILDSQGVERARRENVVSGTPAPFSVTPGVYTILAEGYHYSSGDLKAEGSITNKTIGQGQNGDILVPMGPPKDGLLSINISSNPNKMNYNIGDSLDLTGLVVEAQYASGGPYVIPHRLLQIDFNSSTSGAKTVTVSYGGQSATITGIYVGTATLTGISVTTQPTKTNYNVGEQIDLSGLVVTASYSDGSTSPVTSFSVSPEIFSTAGTITVTITYGNPPNQQTATFTVTVIGATAGITVTVGQIVNGTPIILHNINGNPVSISNPLTVNRSGPPVSINITGAFTYLRVWFNRTGLNPEPVILIETTSPSNPTTVSLDASNAANYPIGLHNLLIEVVAGGISYQANIPFRVVQ
jgi:hypothetical protein